jgi:quinol-cytochrome oxidoreductase complex cytochrome b subunit
MSEVEIEKEDQTIPFFPDHIRTEAFVAIGFIILALIIGALAVRYPVGLGEPADPMNTPAHAKPEWYFLFLYEILKYVPKTLGSILPFVGIFIVIIWPFLDKREDTMKARRNRIILSVVAIFIVIALTLMGEFL